MPPKCNCPCRALKEEFQGGNKKVQSTKLLVGHWTIWNRTEHFCFDNCLFTIIAYNGCGLKSAKYSHFSPEVQYGYKIQNIVTLYAKSKCFDYLSLEFENCNNKQSKQSGWIASKALKKNWFSVNSRPYIYVQYELWFFENSLVRPREIYVIEWR